MKGSQNYELTQVLPGQIEEEEDTIDLLPLIRAVLRKWWLILLVACLCAAAGYAAVHAFVSPTYRATFSAYVNNSVDTHSQSPITSSDVAANKSLANTYNKIIISRAVLQQAADEIGCALTYKQLKQMVESSVETNTEIITVTVTTHDPLLSKDLADAVYKVAAEVGAAVVDGSSMRAYEVPVLPEGIYSPNYTKTAILCFAAGFLLTAFGVMLLEYLDNRVKSQESLEERFGLVVLGSVPNFTAAFNGNGSNRYYNSYGYGQSGQNTQSGQSGQHSQHSSQNAGGKQNVSQKKPR